MRDVLIIGVACIVAIGAGIWLYLFGLNEPKERQDIKEIPVIVLTEGEHSGLFTERKSFRIRSLPELDQLYDMMYDTERPALPEVNFDQNEVFAIFDGEHPSGGFDVRVVSVRDDGTSRHIALSRIVPGKECVTSEAITSPFSIVVVSKSELPVVREEKTETYSCK